MVSASFHLEISISRGTIKKLLQTTRNNNKTHNKIVMLATSKLNRIESKIPEALINNEISHEDFIQFLIMKKISRIERKH